MDTAAHPDKAEREKEEVQAQLKQEAKDKAKVIVEWALMISKIKKVSAIETILGKGTVNVDAIDFDVRDAITATAIMGILETFGMQIPPCPKTVSEALAGLKAAKEAVDGKEHAEV